MSGACQMNWGESETRSRSIEGLNGSINRSFSFEDDARCRRILRRSPAIDSSVDVRLRRSNDELALSLDIDPNVESVQSILPRRHLLLGALAIRRELLSRASSRLDCGDAEYPSWDAASKLYQLRLQRFSCLVASRNDSPNWEELFLCSGGTYEGFRASSIIFFGNACESDGV